MLKPKYQIGDELYRAQFETLKQKTEVCKDCLGKKYLTVIMGDDTRVTIDCVACANGFENPKGFHYIWEPEASSVKILVIGIVIHEDKIEYKFNSYNYCYEDMLFNTKKEADIAAEKLMQKYKEEQLQRIAYKEKDYKSWSWNATYHRGRIREAKKQLEYHESKLNVAVEKVKQYGKDECLKQN